MQKKLAEMTRRAGRKTKLAVAAGLVALTGVASADPVDMSAVTTGIQDQVSEAFTTIGPIVGVILAIGVGMKLIRRWLS